MFAEFGAVDHRRPLVEQPGQRTQQPGFALAALAEQHNIMAGDQRPFQLRQHRVVEPEDSRPDLVAVRQRGQQVLPDLLPDSSLAVTGGTQPAEGIRKILRII